MALAIEVQARRGELVESRHRITWVAVDAAGRKRDGSGTDLVTTFRSAAKPFQLLPLVERGHASALGLSDEQLAIMAASHTGSAHHRTVVRQILDALALGVDDLACGAHDPSDPEALAEIRLHPELLSRLYNNCSGKHSGMLALAQREGWPLKGYELAEHPLQQLMRRTIAEVCGCAAESLGVAVDGCGVCVFSLPMSAMARGYARLAEAARSPEDARGRALQRIALAMAAHPRTVEGEGRLSTALMTVTGGRLVAKGGAEGLQLIADTSRGAGLALKCEDGAGRAVAPATVALLESIGWIAAEEASRLEGQRRPLVKNAAGLVVGHLEATVSSTAAV